VNRFGDRAGYCGAVVLCCAVLLLLRQSKAVFGGLACCDVAGSLGGKPLSSHHDSTRIRRALAYGFTGYRNRHMIRHMAPRVIDPINFLLPNKYWYLPYFQHHLRSTCSPSTQIHSIYRAKYEST
jgi:hypothetical protein